MFVHDDDWITVAQATELCHITAAAIRTRLHAPNAPTHQTAGKRLILINRESMLQSDWFIRRS